MTTTPPEAPPPPYDDGPRVTRDQVSDLGRLRRSSTDRKLAGVAGGLGRHLDIDPLVLRVAFVVLAFFGGAGLILYAACWLLVPADDAERATVHLDERSRSVALVVLGVIAAAALIGDSWGAFWFPWPLAVVALVVLWLMTRRDNPPAGTATTTSTPAATPATFGPPAPVNPYAAPASAAAAHAASAYAAAPTQPPTTPPAPPVWQPPPPRPSNPRKRGPILFWLTLALCALGVGVLGVLDVAGLAVASSAYPAVVVAVCGVMLLVGAFYGRAGGIILVGLLASLGLVVSTAADRWDDQHERFAPVSVTAMGDHYEFDAGDRVVDLRDVADVDDLDGHTLRIRGDVGRVRVYLPPGIGADVSARIDGIGHVDLFGDQQGGTDFIRISSVNDDSDVQLTIDVELGVGSIEVSQS